MTPLVPLLLAAALAAIPGAPGRARLAAWGPRGGAAPWRPGVRAAVAVAVPAAGLAWGVAAMAAAAVCAATALHLRAGRAAARARRRDAADMAAALEIVAAELRVGAHPGRACEAAARHTRGGPVAARLATAAAQAQLGGTVSRALTAGAPAGAWHRLAAVWAVAEHRGIALAGLVDVARRDLTTRASHRRRAEAGLAGARSTAVILAALPAVGVGLGHLMGARPLGVLTGGGIGAFLLVVGVVLDCAGLVWAERIAAGAAR